MRTARPRLVVRVRRRRKARALVALITWDTLVPGGIRPCGLGGSAPDLDHQGWLQDWRE